MNISQRLKLNNRHQDAQVKIFRDRIINDQKFERALDVSCGNGFFSYICRGFVDEIYGVDIYDFYDKKFLRRHFKKVTFEKYDGKSIPYPNGFFDLVFSMDVLEHVDDLLAFLKEQLRVLKKGGLFLVGTPNLKRLSNLPLLLTGQLKFPKKLGEDEYGDCVHVKEYDKDDLILLMEQIHTKNYSLIPCYFGVKNIGILDVPRILENFCQFWFISFKKQS